jgi:hypothetical protein
MSETGKYYQINAHVKCHFMSCHFRSYVNVLYYHYHQMMIDLSLGVMLSQLLVIIDMSQPVITKPQHVKCFSVDPWRYSDIHEVLYFPADVIQRNVSLILLL